MSIETTMNMATIRALVGDEVRKLKSPEEVERFFDLLRITIINDIEDNCVHQPASKPKIYGTFYNGYQESDMVEVDFGDSSYTLNESFTSDGANLVKEVFDQEDREDWCSELLAAPVDDPNFPSVKVVVLIEDEIKSILNIGEGEHVWIETPVTDLSKVYPLFVVAEIG